MRTENELAVRTTGAGPSISSVTDEVADFLERAEKIAASLNHPQITAAHLILAITLSGYASDQFRKQFPEEGVYLACWHRLGELRPSKDGKSTGNIDSDVRDVLTQAATIANTRDPQNRATQVGDVLQVLSATPPGSRLDEILRGRASITAADVHYRVREIRDQIELLTHRLDESQAGLQGILAALAKQGTRQIFYVGTAAVALLALAGIVLFR